MEDASNQIWAVCSELSRKQARSDFGPGWVCCERDEVRRTAKTTDNSHSVEVQCIHVARGSCILRR